MSVSAFPYGTVKAPAGGGGPTVSALANGDYNYNEDATCYAGVKFDSNGEEYERTFSGGYGASVGTWLDSGASSEVWVEYINATGSFIGKTVNVRYQINVDQDFHVTRVFNGTRTCTCQFRFWDAASGGNILQTTASASWSAEYSSSGGPCSLC